MTYTQIVSYTTLLALTVSMLGLSTVQASEVIGTLSSGAANTEVSADGSISGTVTNGNTSSGGGSRSGGATRTTSDATNAPTGSVLGAASSNTGTPGFPNAGNATGELSLGATAWSYMIMFLKNIFTV